MANRWVKNTTAATLKYRSVLGVVAIVAFGLLSTAATNSPRAAGADAPGAGADIVVRRLTADQYRQIITDVFGASFKIGGRFEPDIRANDLLAIGSSHVSVTATGLEQYDSMARGIAAQVVDEQHRPVLFPCAPASPTEADDVCAKQFLGKAERMLYRRPVTQEEIDRRVAVAAAGAKTLKSFYAGIELSVADMLVSPQFLFRKEVAEPDPAHPGQYRLNAVSKASQLSFFLWNTAPDQELLAAAESGELNTDKGLARQVDRLVSSPRLEAGVRAFFTDMLGFDEFSTLAKDGTIYPKFTTQLADDAQEQTLKTIVDQLLTQHGDYRDLFTTRKTFLTPLLGTVYKVPVTNDAPNGAPEKWQPHEYVEGDPRAGILVQASFVALHAHPGRSSATLRGKALREILLCQKVPAPPANVNFTVVQDTGNPLYKTARARLTAHRTDPVCAGCHKIMDPMGLALENFDSSGAYRTDENGAPIDASGELDGVQFKDAAGLAKAVHDHPDTPKCLATRLYSYGTGRPPIPREADWMKSLLKGFADDGYKLPELFKRIATSDDFYRVSAPQTGALDTPMPKLASQSSSELEVQK